MSFYKGSGSLKDLKISQALLGEIETLVFTETPEEMESVIGTLDDRYGEALDAVIFYGSCLQKSDLYDGLVDLYVIVNSYRRALRNPLSALANRILPPNVYYLEVDHNGKTVRVKYAVISMEQFKKACSVSWFHSSFWARFAQPLSVVFVKDIEIRAAVIWAVASAVTTFLRRVIPCVGKEFDVKTLYYEGLLLSYSAELRPEREERVRALVATGMEWFSRITPIAIGCTGYTVLEFSRQPSCHWRMAVTDGMQRRCMLQWSARRVLGKILSVLRLVKAAFTFSGGVDYALWKIERHSGVSINATPFMRRHPLVAMAALWWKVFKRGGVK